MSRLIIHAGLHKTGTSALQVWLSRNAAALAKLGIAFPAELLGKSGNAPLVAQSMLQKVSELDGEMRKVRKDFLAFCQANAESDIVLSAEYFEILFVEIHHSEIDAAEAGRLDAVKSLDFFEPELNRFVRLLKKFASAAGVREIVVVYLTRNSIDKKNSALAQRVKTLFTANIDSNTFDSASLGYSFLAYTHRVMEREGISVRVDVMGCDSRNVVEQFLDLAGLGNKVRGAIETQVEIVNESIGEIGFLACAQAFRVLETHGLHRNRGICLKTSLAIRKLSAALNDRRFSAFTSEAAKRHMDGQARLDALLAPMLGPEKLAILRKPRHRVDFSVREPTLLPEEAKSAFNTLMQNLVEELRNQQLPLSDAVLSEMTYVRTLNLTRFRALKHKPLSNRRTSTRGAEA